MYNGEKDFGDKRERKLMFLLSLLMLIFIFSAFLALASMVKNKKDVHRAIIISSSIVCDISRYGS